MYHIYTYLYDIRIRQFCRLLNTFSMSITDAFILQKKLAELLIVQNNCMIPSVLEVASFLKLFN